jgi:serine/threonine-protein kinase RsbT
MNKKYGPGLYPSPRSDDKQGGGKQRVQSQIDARIPIIGVEDIVEARQKGRFLATELDFSLTQATLVATAISELARNIVLYAKTGEIILVRLGKSDNLGVMITAIDKGPGIPNIQHALMNGFSSSGGLGLGLPGVRQMVDEFEIESSAGEGTTVTAVMWQK